MAQFRSASAVLATLALAGAALPVEANALPTGRHHSPVAQTQTVLLRRSVKPAVYAVRVAITTPSSRGGLITLKIGKLWRRTVIGARSPHARVRVQLPIRGGMLTIRATAQQGRPKLDVQLRRVRSLAKRSGSGAKTRASGPHAPTSLTAPIVAPPPAAPPVPPAAATAVAAAGPPGDAASWHQVFADEFNSPTLDTTKWSSGWQGGSAPVSSGELECYDPAQIALTNGELDLNLIAQQETCSDGQTRPYASGMVNTEGKFNYTYGYLEARVWVSGTTAMTDWPAVWTDGQNWPQDGELDVMEGLSGQACWHFHDPLGGPGGCSSAPFTGGWHTFGADWEAGTVTYYYDGTPVGTLTSGITSSPMYIILNLAADNSNSGPLQAPATMRVDYVRLWQH